MPDLEKISLELESLSKSMKLTIGDGGKFWQEIQQITHAHNRIEQIHREIEEELGVENIKQKVAGAIPWLGSAAVHFIPGGFLVDSLIQGGAEFVANKLKNEDKEVSLTDLLQQTETFLAWGEWLKQFAKNICTNQEFLEHLEQASKSPSVIDIFRQIDNSFRINLSFENPEILKQQLQQVMTAQEQLMQLQSKLDKIIPALGANQNVHQQIKALLSFYGKAMFAVVGLNQEEKDQLFIESQGQVTSVDKLLQECEELKQKSESLSIQLNILRASAEQVLQVKAANKPHKQAAKITRNLAIMFASVAVLGSVGWVSWDKVVSQQQVVANSPQTTATENLKSAQSLGREAAKMVQKPPHPLKVWQESKAKWQQAIKLLENIPEGTSVFAEAKKHLVTYRANYAAINQRILAEQKAAANLASAEKLAQEASVLVQKPPQTVKVWQQAQTKWQQAIKLLESVPQGSYAYTQVKQKLPVYKSNYAAVSKRVTTLAQQQS
jgi:hypothetical protein